jgi:hypothetical protein
MGRIHIVKSRRNVSHQGHEKERDLENIVLYEVQPFDHFIIPRRTFKIDYEREEP